MMTEAGKLFLVSTPIGNLKDITLRALEALRAAQWIACEDTRQTRKLLSHYDIHVPVTSFHDHTSSGKLDFILRELESGKSVAYVTDGGTPLISDPGYALVRSALEKGIAVEGIPGPAALVAGLVVSGVPCEKFVFEGFLPYKEGAMRRALEKLREEERTMVFYESPHRIEKTLRAMTEIFGARRGCLSREMTKQFEEQIRGTLPEILRETLSRKKLGEIVLIVEGADGIEKAEAD